MNHTDLSQTATVGGVALVAGLLACVAWAVVLAPVVLLAVGASRLVSALAYPAAVAPGRFSRNHA